MKPPIFKGVPVLARFLLYVGVSCEYMQCSILGETKLKIMIIDDELDCMESLAAALEPAGHHVDMFSSPIEAVSAYKKGIYDVVITDMRMPHMTGLQVIRILHQMDSEARVIIMTGYGDAETAIAAVNENAFAFFPKPVNCVELFEVLDKVGKEKEKQILSQEEQARMLVEYQRLKNAYDDILRLLNEKSLKVPKG